jgi:hypothetical protein
MSTALFPTRWIPLSPLVVLLILVSPSRAHAQDFRAGAAVVDITPPTGFPLWGYAARKDQPSDGVLDPLKARALVLAAGKERIAFVSLDLGRPPTRASFAVIQARAKAVGVDHVFLVASHTHHGPCVELDDWPTPKTSYVRQLEQKIGDVIADAVKTMKPARYDVAAKEVPFNRNRHSKRAEKPVDRELFVLRVEDTDGKPIAHAVNFAAHATMVDAKGHKFSADYPGVLAALVEKETGAPCLFLQGAAGDLSPDSGRGAGHEAFGRALGQEVLALGKTIRCAVPEKPTLATREEEMTFTSRIDLSNATVNLLYSRAFFPALVAFYEREYKAGIRPRLTTALLDGRIGFVGVSGEFFCGHSLSLKRRARLEHVFFLGYCNDYQQYFPTIEAAAEGGYGAGLTVSPIEVGAGEKMMDRALIHLFQMRGRFPG